MNKRKSYTHKYIQNGTQTSGSARSSVGLVGVLASFDCLIIDPKTA